MSTRVREYTFKVGGSFRSGRRFSSDFLVYATSLDEASRQLELCLGTFDEIAASTVESVTDADADDYGTEQYLEDGAFSVFDPRFAGEASDA